MRNRRIEIIGVFLLSIILLLYCGKLLAPTWYEWNNDNTIKGLYNEPKNRIQLLFLGTSQVVSGISPIRLYDDYGICAYNLGTEQQPLLSSYYLLKEVYRLHSESLSVAVLDISFLFNDEDEDNSKLAFNEKALMNLRLSPIKIEAIRACARQYADVNAMEYLFPLIRYHSRWSLLNENDFSGLSNDVNSFYTRGQYLFFTKAKDSIEEQFINIPNYSITPQYENLSDGFDEIGSDTGMEYLDLIVQYCNENNINLVFIKIAKASDDGQHDVASYIADNYGVPFLDFNDVRLQDEVGLWFPTDYADNTHPNVWGADKISKYIGRYLKEHYLIRDIREDEKYSYLEDLRQQYSLVDENKKLSECKDLLTYLSEVDNDRYTVFFSVKDDAFRKLPEDIINKMAEKGLINFESLDFRIPYLGVLDNGDVLEDMVGEDEASKVYAEGVFDDSKEYQIISAGFDGENKSSIVIGKKEYSQNHRGINIVVYDKSLHRVIDTCCFDIFDHSKRVGNDVSNAYYLRVDTARINSSEEITTFINNSLSDDSHILIICGHKADETNADVKKVIKAAKELSLKEPERLIKEGYIGIIKGNEVIFEDDINLEMGLIQIEDSNNRIAVYNTLDDLISVSVNRTEYYVSQNELILIVINMDFMKVVSVKRI